MKENAWTVRVHTAVADELAALADRAYARVRCSLAALERDPFRARAGCDVKKLKEYPDATSLHRLRVGRDRMLYFVVRHSRAIDVVVFEKRGLGYERLTKLAESRR